jgi:hypothetical protein
MIGVWRPILAAAAFSGGRLKKMEGVAFRRLSSL